MKLIFHHKALITKRKGFNGSVNKAFVKNLFSTQNQFLRKLNNSTATVNHTFVLSTTGNEETRTTSLEQCENKGTCQAIELQFLYVIILTNPPNAIFRLKMLPKARVEKI